LKLEVEAVGYRIVKGFVAAMAAALMVAGPASAADESREDVLKRIKPVGEVSVEGQAAAPAPAAEAAAPDSAAAPGAEAPAAAAPTAAPATDSSDPAALAQAKGCMACHQIATKVVGPAYKDVAAKYKGDAGALDTLVAKVKAGGSGNWGQVPMPPQGATVTDDELKTLVKWVLSQ
jgi:cytochrome c